MNSDKKTARIVGALFIIATVIGVISVAFSPGLDSPDYLITVSSNGNLAIATFLVVVMVAAGVGIGVMMFPILKKQNEGLALGYVSAKTIEAVFILVSAISLLALEALSLAFMKAGAADASYFQVLGGVLLAAQNWAHWIGISIVFPLGALLLNGLFYQSKLIPRWLSAWGLVGAALYLAQGLLMLFGLLPENSALETVWALPIAVQEMALAVWLIVRGFKSPDFDSESVKAEAKELIAAHPG